MDENEMIDFYEELVETLQSLNKEVPEIKRLYDNAKEELEQSLSAVQNAVSGAKDELRKAEASSLDRITKISSGRKKQVDDQLMALDDVMKKASKLQKALDISTDYVKRTEEKIEKLNQHLTQVDDYIDTQQDVISKLEKRIGLFEEKLKEILPVVEVDYEELSTAIDLYNKYNGRIDRPVVLEKANYTNDYCFRVSGIDEEESVLIGRFYRQGKLYGEKDTFPFSTRCRMFKGDTLGDVIEGDI